MLGAKLHDVLRETYAQSEVMYKYTCLGLRRYKAEVDVALIREALDGREVWSNDLKLDISYENPIQQMAGWYLRAIRAMNEGDLRDFYYAFINWRMEAEKDNISRDQVDEDVKKKYNQVKFRAYNPENEE